MADSPDPTAAPALAPAAERYDPADYRWVPVRRVPRHDGWTEEKQRRFIEVLADTGQVRAAAHAVGMTRETAYRLRRSPHGAAFARAWDVARHHSGALLEDVAFERAIEGEERPVFDESGEMIPTKRVVNDRLLMFLLRHLKPERYAADALARPADPPSPAALEASLREMEPQLPAPIEALLDADTLEDELVIADIADGVLPHFLGDRPPDRPVARRRRPTAALIGRGEAARVKEAAGEDLDEKEIDDMCRLIVHDGVRERPRRRYR